MGAIIKAKEAMDRKRLTAFELTRNWFDFAFENPEKVNVMQTALFMWLIEANNRAGWAMKFAFNTEDAGFACGVNNRKTVWKALNELIDNGFVTMVYKSSHQHKPTVISLMSELKETEGSLDNALLNLSEKRTTSDLPREQYADNLVPTSALPNGHSLKQQTTNNKQENNKQNNNGVSDFSNDFDSEKIIPLQQAETKNENSFEEKEKKLAPKKEKDFSEIQWPFDSAEFKRIWDIWIEYRKQQRLKPYMPIGLQAALTKLANDANGNESEAVEIIKFSMSKQWQGLYPEKNKTINSRQPKTDWSHDINTVINHKFK